MARVKGAAVDASLRYARERFGEAGKSSPGPRTSSRVTALAGAPQFCQRVHGRMERTLELAGARNVRLDPGACVHRGDALCRFEATRE